MAAAVADVQLYLVTPHVRGEPSLHRAAPGGRGTPVGCDPSRLWAFTERESWPSILRG